MQLKIEKSFSLYFNNLFKLFCCYYKLGTFKTFSRKGLVQLLHLLHIKVIIGQCTRWNKKKKKPNCYKNFNTTYFDSFINCPLRSTLPQSQYTFAFDPAIQ